jgi:hypothetical protein
MSKHLSYNADGFIDGCSDDPANFERSIPAPDGFDFAAIEPGTWRVQDGQVVPVSTEPPPPLRKGLTHYAFRSLFSITEQIILDNFENPDFRAAHPVLRHFDIMLLATLKTAYKNYEAVKDFDLDDPGTVLFVGTLAQLGLLESPARATRILSGLPPE